ncbi:MAG TPA: bifunctional 5,10-methylene-tetrahydrofolate dehydrogenase/5,10-methylene-tetrahydrofolate cyclohydrolase [Lachnospiraceae bacterium]|nr:bifunctional 5,10-methylene-tetrahydrofolate dehydrogenase/5,10-methylene-tetrahydrofolate cyclohydrolase [Lachnospiraceae bacterium]
MAKLLSGKEVALALTEEVKERVCLLREKGVAPALCIIRVGEKPGDISYERGARKRCEMTGILCRTICLPEDVSQEELLRVIRECNEDDSVHGVLLLRPLPATLDEVSAANALVSAKDVDCMTDLSISGLLSGRGIGFAPCTAQAAMAFLDHYGIDAAGKRAVVIGRSLVFGKPAALMLTDRNATVTLCHTRTRDLSAVARQADLLLVACGHAGVVGADCVRPGQVVIDVGINTGPDGKLCGDVSFGEVEPIVEAITPVPGGVGAVTTSILARHVVQACENLKNRSS